MTLEAAGSPPTGAAGADHHFPRFHVRPPAGFLNDPNGPVLIDGTYHLYFQHRVGTALSGPVRWGHATSTDLARWTLHPPAIVPTPGHGDRDGCWSGNTVVHDGVLHAFYSGCAADRRYQSVVTARSQDGGFTFGPPEAVDVDPLPDEGVLHFRDPFVWREGEGWRMVVGAGSVGDVASARAYASDDLRRWKRVEDLAALARERVDGNDSGEMWECPQVVRLDGREVLVVGSWTDGGGIMHALSTPVGADLGDPVLRRVDHGPSFYAASVLRESDVGPLMWGWAPETAGATRPVDGWAGVLTLPRRLSLGADDELLSAPPPSLTALRVAELQPSPTCEATAQLEIEAQVAEGGRGGLRLTFGTDDWLSLDIDDASSTVSVELAVPPGGRSADVTSSVICDALRPGSGAPSVRIFVDGSIAEVFTSAGRVFTVRFYAQSPPPWQLSTHGLERVAAWSLDT